MAEMTDEQWIKQNSNLGPTRARLLGKCGKCGGKGKLWWAFGGERGCVKCDLCRGSGKAQ